MNINQIASHIENNKIDTFLDNTCSYINNNLDKYSKLFVYPDLSIKQNLILSFLADCDFEKVSNKIQKINGFAWGGNRTSFWMKPWNALHQHTLLGELWKEKQIKEEHFIELFKMFETYNERLNFFLESIFSIDEICLYFSINFRKKYFEFNQNRVGTDKNFCNNYIMYVPITISSLEFLYTIYPELIDKNNVTKFTRNFYYNLLTSSVNKNCLNVDWLIKYYEIFLNNTFNDIRKEIIFGLKTQTKISNEIDTVIVKKIFKQLEK